MTDASKRRFHEEIEDDEPEFFMVQSIMDNFDGGFGSAAQLNACSRWSRGCTFLQCLRLLQL